MPKHAGLTDLKIDKFEAVDGKRVTVFDDGKGSVPGLAVRVTERGVKSFVVITNFQGKQRWVTLGRYPVLRLANARVKAREVLEK